MSVGSEALVTVRADLAERIRTIEGMTAHSALSGRMPPLPTPDVERIKALLVQDALVGSIKEMLEDLDDDHKAIVRARL